MKYTVLCYVTCSTEMYQVKIGKKILYKEQIQVTENVKDLIKPINAPPNRFVGGRQIYTSYGRQNGKLPQDMYMGNPFYLLVKTKLF